MTSMLTHQCSRAFSTISCCFWSTPPHWQSGKVQTETEECVCVWNIISMINGLHLYSALLTTQSTLHHLWNQRWTWEWTLPQIDVLILYQIIPGPEPPISVLATVVCLYSHSSLSCECLRTAWKRMRKEPLVFHSCAICSKKMPGWMSGYQKQKLRQNWHSYLNTKLMCVPTLKLWCITDTFKEIFKFKF